ncbi:MAG: GTPase HflX [Spirochaetaceae bacterium]|nr:GTPase HflX [Spirochaetaceae bacterium]
MMMLAHENAAAQDSREKALLVGVASEKTRKQEALDLLDELAALADTLGVEVVDRLLVNLRERSPAMLVGSGKADEIAAAAKALSVDSIIFDHILTPVQQRNWESYTGKKVYDRSELIIRIFAARALTREASLQVELAQLQYALPRLVHSYDDLMRQRGGRYGTKGSGEQKLELDRREIERRIHEIRLELEEVRKARAVRKKRRERIPIPRAAIVGYTNAGKSSLLNALTRAEVLAEDKLFATLDPTTRRLQLAQGQVLLLTDTVGFIRNLPHGLIEAFRATLEEASEADLLIHVADASDRNVEVHMATTVQVLQEIGAGDIPRILVLNKIDIAQPQVVEEFLQKHQGALAVSVRTGEGMETLRSALQTALTASMPLVKLRIPHADYAITSLVLREGTLVEEHHDDEATWIVCRVPERLLPKLQPYLTQTGWHSEREGASS